MKRKQEEIDFRVFSRVVWGSKRKFYNRFLYNGEPFLTRSTDAPTAAKAGIIAKKIIDEEDLLSLAKSRTQSSTAALEVVDNYGQMPVVDFLHMFWDEGHSPYLQDLAAAGRPLSGRYCYYMQRNTENFFVKASFAQLPMRDLKFKHIDGLFRDLRKTKKRAMLNSIRRTIQKPCSWLAERGVIEKINFAGLILPKESSQERGILTLDEFQRILDIEPQGPWQDQNHKLHIGTRWYPLSGSSSRRGSS